MCLNYNKLVSDGVTVKKEIEILWKHYLQQSHDLSSFMRPLMWNQPDLILCWRCRSWLIVQMHFGYIWHILRLLHNNEQSKAAAGFTCNFSLTHLLLFSTSASVCVSACEGCVYVTWTDSDEMNSSERWEWLWRNWERVRANATIWAWRELHRYVHACMCGSAHTVHINIKWVSVDIYIKMCPISIVHVCPGGYQASIWNAALWSVIDIHLEALYAITTMSLSLSLISE